MSVTEDRVRDVVEPLVAELGATVYDVVYAGGVLRISLQRAEGLDMGLITDATRRISAALDEADPLPSAYTLEVSSPGLERQLRTEAHYAGAVGEQVRIKTRAGVEGDRRAQGELVAVSGGTVTVRTEDGSERTLSIDDIDRAHTHVQWEPAPKPGGGSKPGTSKGARSRTSSTSTPRSEATP